MAIESIIEEVKKDPKMMLLSQAQNIIVDQQKGLIKFERNQEEHRQFA